MGLTPQMLEELTKGYRTPEELSTLYSQLLQHMTNRGLQAEIDARMPGVWSWLRHGNAACSSG